MGLLDSVLGQVLGGGAPTQGGGTGSPGSQDGFGNQGGLGGLGGLGNLGGLGSLGGLAGALGALLANNGGQGGLGGMVSKFEQAGMGDVIGSWIGKGDNVPVSGGQLGNVLGGDVVSGLAQKLGINAATLLPLLASVLPMLIDRLTPHGRVPEQGLGDLSNLDLGNLGGADAGGAGQPDARTQQQAGPGTESELLASLSALLQKR